MDVFDGICNHRYHARCYYATALCLERVFVASHAVILIIQPKGSANGTWYTLDVCWYNRYNTTMPSDIETDAVDSMPRSHVLSSATPS